MYDSLWPSHSYNEAEKVKSIDSGTDMAVSRDRNGN